MKVFDLNFKYNNGIKADIKVATINNIDYKEVKVLVISILNEQKSNGYDYLNLTELETELIDNHGFLSVEEIIINFD